MLFKLPLRKAGLPADWCDPTIKYEDEIFGKRKPGQELKEEVTKKPWEL